MHGSKDVVWALSIHAKLAPGHLPGSGRLPGTLRQEYILLTTVIAEKYGMVGCIIIVSIVYMIA